MVLALKNIRFFIFDLKKNIARNRSLTKKIFYRKIVQVTLDGSNSKGPRKLRGIKSSCFQKVGIFRVDRWVLNLVLQDFMIQPFILVLTLRMYLTTFFPVRYTDLDLNRNKYWLNSWYLFYSSNYDQIPQYHTTSITYWTARRIVVN